MDFVLSFLLMPMLWMLCNFGSGSLEIGVKVWRTQKRKNYQMKSEAKNAYVITGFCFHLYANSLRIVAVFAEVRLLYHAISVFLPWIHLEHGFQPVGIYSLAKLGWGLYSVITPDCFYVDYIFTSNRKGNTHKKGATLYFVALLITFSLWCWVIS